MFQVPLDVFQGLHHEDEEDDVCKKENCTEEGGLVCCDVCNMVWHPVCLEPSQSDTTSLTLTTSLHY